MTTIAPSMKGRLTRLKNQLEDLEWKLNYMHADRSGAFRSVYRVPPLLRPEGASVRELVARIEADAKGGCLYSAQWLCDTAELRARVDHLNRRPLAERDTDYTGPSVFPFRLPSRKQTGVRARLRAEREGRAHPTPTSTEVAEAAQEFEPMTFPVEPHWETGRWRR